jgi:hypothetical protein
MSNKAKFWWGVLLTIPVVVVTGFLASLPPLVISAVLGGDNAYPAGGIASIVVNVLLLGLLVAAIVWERTRYLALGVLAGTALLFVLVAGACAVLLATYTGG